MNTSLWLFYLLGFGANCSRRMSYGPVFLDGPFGFGTARFEELRRPLPGMSPRSPREMYLSLAVGTQCCEKVCPELNPFSSRAMHVDVASNDMESLAHYDLPDVEEDAGNNALPLSTWL